MVAKAIAANRFISSSWWQMANVNLSQRDIDYISRVVATEVPSYLQQSNPETYNAMVKGVVDVMTNRIASGQYPSTIAGVANQKSQFSKINGPSKINPYGSVEATPGAPASVRAVVENYIADRAQGTEPLVGGALNYANPYASDQSNLDSWINPMIDNGAVEYGVGTVAHAYGTPPGTTPADPSYALTAEGIPSSAVPSPYGPNDVTVPDPLGQTAFTGTVEVPEMSYADAPRQADRWFGSVMRAPEAPELASYVDPSVTTAYRDENAPNYSQADLTANGRNSIGPQLDYGRFSPPTPQAPDLPSVDQTTSQLADAKTVTAPEMSVADQYQSYGLGRQALETAIAPQVADLNLSEDVAAANPGRVAPPNVTPTVPDMATTAGVASPTQPVEAPEPVSGTAHTSRSTARSQSGVSDVNRQNAWSDTQKLSSLQQQDKIFGGIAKVLGGILGTAVLGPLGGVLGAVAAPALLSPITNQAGRFYPTAPVNPNGERKGYGYSSLSDVKGSEGYSGRDIYDDSKQFHDAVDSGKGGLW